MREKNKLENSALKHTSLNVSKQNFKVLQHVKESSFKSIKEISYCPNSR